MRLPLVLALLVWPFLAFAQTPESLGQFRDWQAFTVQIDNQTVCYLTTSAKSVEGQDNTESDYLIVSRRPKDKVAQEINLVAQNPYSKGKSVRVAIEPQNSNFEFFTDTNNAWAKDASMDSRVTAAMRRGATLVAEHTDAQGKAVRQRYSLMGFSAAFDAVNQRCPLP